MSDAPEKKAPRALVECPHCGSREFFVPAQAIVMLTRNPETGNLVTETPPNGFECGGNGEEELECAGCNTNDPFGGEYAFVRTYR